MPGSFLSDLPIRRHGMHMSIPRFCKECRSRRPRLALLAPPLPPAEAVKHRCPVVARTVWQAAALARLQINLQNQRAPLTSKASKSRAQRLVRHAERNPGFSQSSKELALSRVGLLQCLSRSRGRCRGSIKHQVFIPYADRQCRGVHVTMKKWSLLLLRPACWSGQLQGQVLALGTTGS